MFKKNSYQFADSQIAESHIAESILPIPILPNMEKYRKCLFWRNKFLNLGDKTYFWNHILDQTTMPMSVKQIKYMSW